MTAKKRYVGNTLNAKETSRRTDRVRLLPWSGDQDGHLLSLMMDMTRRVAALQDAVADMRQENKLNYRQLKRHMLKLSSASESSQNNGNRPTNFESRPRSFVHSGRQHSVNYIVISLTKIRWRHWAISSHTWDINPFCTKVQNWLIKLKCRIIIYNSMGYNAAKPDRHNHSCVGISVEDIRNVARDIRLYLQLVLKL